MSTEELVEAAKVAVARRFRRGAALSNRKAVRDFLTIKLGSRDHEVFAVCPVNAQGRLIEYVELFRGTLDGASVHPREVVKPALDHRAASVALVHNHASSGVAEPSQADERITERLVEAMALVDIRVLDHLIVGGATCVSLAECGLLRNVE